MFMCLNPCSLQTLTQQPLAGTSWSGKCTYLSMRQPELLSASYLGHSGTLLARSGSLELIP